MPSTINADAKVGCGWTLADCALGESCPCWNEPSPTTKATILSLETRIDELEYDFGHEAGKADEAWRALRELQAASFKASRGFRAVIQELADRVVLKGEVELEPLLAKLTDINSFFQDALDDAEI